MTMRSVWPVLASVALCSCSDSNLQNRDPASQELIVRAMEVPDSAAWLSGRPDSVAVYADRSGSMRGFLDPAYPNQQDYRAVIDGLQARLSPSRIYSFGSGVNLQKGARLDLLGDAGFYTDLDTRMDDVFRVVAADTQRVWTHIIVGDGRRDTPNQANRQYVLMREAAEAWIQGGGMFLVGVSSAPFRPVKGDQSGCHTSPAVAVAADSAVHCPLYAFAFATPGHGIAVAEALSGLFTHLWAIPVPTVPLHLLGLKLEEVAGSTPVDPRWFIKDGVEVPKVESREIPTALPLRLRLVPRDTTGARRRLVSTLLNGHEVISSISALALASGADPWAWEVRDGTSGPVRIDADQRGLQVFMTHGDDCLAAGPGDPCGALFRLELNSRGSPTWLPQFDATDAADTERTFGLNRLFESFRARAAEMGPTVARVYLLVR